MRLATNVPSRLGAESDPDRGGVPGDLVEDLVAVEHAADRAAGEPGGEGGDRLGADEGLGAEGAPHRRDDDPDVLRGDAEDAGQVLAHVERRLGAGDHLEPTADPLGVGRVRLHRHVRRRRGVEDLVDDHLRVVERVGERLVGIVQVGDDADLLATPQARGPDAEPVADVRAVLRSHVEVGRVGLGGVVPLVDEG